MSEEMKDNLQNADGNLVNNANVESQTEATENQIPLDQLKSIEEENTTDTDSIELIELVETQSDVNNATTNTQSEAVEITSNKEDKISENELFAEFSIENNSEIGGEETLKQPHEIELLNYEALSLESLLGELKVLVQIENVLAVKAHVEELKKIFLLKFNHLLEEKRELFFAENPDTLEVFKYSSPLKNQFDQLYSQYTNKKNAHFNSLQNNLKQNLETRLQIVAELKVLIDKQENIKESLKQFNEIRERWKNAGPIPKDKYNHVWNNYHFHLENFYDYLHLDRESRDLDFKHNLEQKQKIIARAKDLLNQTDINKAFLELQNLHKIWKEDIGPVSKDHRESIWEKFSEISKQMHDKREALYEQIRATQLENLDKKKNIIKSIDELSGIKVETHNLWQTLAEKVETLRNEFLQAGKVPSEFADETWTLFKKAINDFNSNKNSFYKEIKKEQNNNLEQKKALIAKAQELKDSTDFAVTTPIMKKIQEDWKNIGHVPRKYSDEIWTEFRAACNHYFNIIKELRQEENSIETEAFNNKKAYLETLQTFELTGNHKTDLDALKLHIETWKKIGKVPYNKRDVEVKFNKLLDVFFEKLTLSKKDSEMIRFSNRMNQLSESNDSRKIESEKIFLIRKIDEIKGEIFQLENNIQFFTNSKNAKKENSIVLEVRKNIQKHKDEMDILKEKLKKLESITIE